MRYHMKGKYHHDVILQLELGYFYYPKTTGTIEYISTGDNYGKKNLLFTEEALEALQDKEAFTSTRQVHVL